MLRGGSAQVEGSTSIDASPSPSPSPLRKATALMLASGNNNNRKGMSINSILSLLNCGMFVVMVTVTHRVLNLHQPPCAEVAASADLMPRDIITQAQTQTQMQTSGGAIESRVFKNLREVENNDRLLVKENARAKDDPQEYHDIETNHENSSEQQNRHQQNEQAPPLVAAKSVPQFDSEELRLMAGMTQMDIKKFMEQQQQDPPSRLAAQSTPRFNSTQLRFAAGMVRVDKEKFMDKYHFGYPERPNIFAQKESESILLIYGSEDIIPASHRAAAIDGTVEPPLFTDPEEATSMCDVMNVVVTGTNNIKGRCLVIQDHYESHHVQMWKRFSPEEPLKLVPQNTPVDHEKRATDYEVMPPRKYENKIFFNDLKMYLDNLDASLDKLSKVLKPIAILNTVTVMVSNHGQAKLLVNFACSARSRGIELNNVVIFATDEATEQIAQSLGFATFYDKDIFARVPTESAPLYGDLAFIKIMWGKIVASHLVAMLGYDFLFQDVDVVWYKDPMQLFMDKNRRESEFDMLFQDDGVRTPRFAPFSANSGFYFSRNNERTLELFTARVLAGNRIMRALSEQAVFDALLIEHSSLYGLRVKTLREEDFSAGRYVAETNVRNWLIGMLRGDHRPWVFHMNWTLNTKEKLQKMRQLGMWYVKDTCPALDSNPEDPAAVIKVRSCCSIEPEIKCTIENLPCALDYRRNATDKVDEVVALNFTGGSNTSLNSTTKR